MDESQTLRSMVRDDAYRVVRVLADGPSGRTELVTLDGEGPLVRKSMPISIANAAAWAAAMELDEPLLPHIESLYRMPDTLVAVYDYVEGQSAADVVREKGPLEPAYAVAVVCDVCHAVSALHARGVVHRDITPSNVILAADGAHLVDLGIARQQVQKRRHDTTTLGTWGFASPEQFGFAQTDARSDVYSLGKLLGYLLTGHAPDKEDYEDALDNRQLVSEELAGVVYKATSFEPSARFQSAQELADAVRGALDATNARPAAHAWAPDASNERKNPASTAPNRHNDPMPEVASRYEYRSKAQAPTDTGVKLFSLSDRQDASQDAEIPRVSGAAAGQSQRPYETFDHMPEPTSAPQRTQRPFYEVPKGLKILVIIYCTAWCGFALLMAIVCIWIFVTGEPATFGAAQQFIGLCLEVGSCMLAYEAYRAVTYAHPYTEQTQPVRLFLRRSVMIVLAALAVMSIGALVLPG